MALFDGNGAIYNRDISFIVKSQPSFWNMADKMIWEGLPDRLSGERNGHRNSVWRGIIVCERLIIPTAPAHNR